MPSRCCAATTRSAASRVPSSTSRLPRRRRTGSRRRRGTRSSACGRRRRIGRCWTSSSSRRPTGSWTAATGSSAGSGPSRPRPRRPARSRSARTAASSTSASREAAVSAPGTIVIGSEAVYCDLAAAIPVVDRVAGDERLVAAARRALPDAPVLPIGTSAAVGSRRRTTSRSRRWRASASSARRHRRRARARGAGDLERDRRGRPLAVADRRGDRRALGRDAAAAGRARSSAVADALPFELALDGLDPHRVQLAAVPDRLRRRDARAPDRARRSTTCSAWTRGRRGRRPSSGPRRGGCGRPSAAGSGTEAGSSAQWSGGRGSRSRR